MKRLRALLVRLAGALALGAVLILPAQSAFAWTWNENTYTMSGSGSTYCGGSSSQPCVLWQEPHYTVLTTSVYLDPSLAGRGTAFGPVLVNNVLPQIKTLPDYAPTYVACYTAGCGSVLSYYGGDLGCGNVYGATFYDSLSASKYTSQNLGAAGVIGWYAFFRGEHIVFNNQIYGNWNTSYNYTSIDYCYFNSDAIKVALHESGHSIALGHTALQGNVMAQGAQNVHAYTSNDVAGFNAVYPGNQPSS
jgi:hypothetical protein